MQLFEMKEESRMFCFMGGGMELWLEQSMHPMGG
jgi:hypothetical protein